MSEKPPPKVSVYLPVYNCETYLELALRSILSQTFEDFEVIVVNDGSTDGTAAILDRMVAEDPRIIVLHQENSGVIDALNAGIKAARGKYLARMDADDVARPERFALQVAKLDAEPDIVALGAQIQLIDPEGRPLSIMELPCDHADLDDRLMQRQSLAISHPAAMLRASAVDQIGGYSNTAPAAEDIDLFLRLAEVGRLANLDSVQLDYRLHHSSIGYTKRVQQMLDAWRAGKAAAERRGVPFTTPRPDPQEGQRTLDSSWRLWGWWALSGGHVATARHYARRALFRNPFSKDNWWLAIIALRGY